MNNWIPVIVILAVLAGGGYYAYRKIKRKVEDVSQALFGTDSLVEGWNKQADELAATPKSVSGMTRIFEPQIQRDFPDFNLVQFKNKAENMLVSALQAIDSMYMPIKFLLPWRRQLQNVHLSPPMRRQFRLD